MARRMIRIGYGHAGDVAHSLALLEQFGWPRASLKLVSAALAGRKIGDEPVALKLKDRYGHELDCLVCYIED